MESISPTAEPFALLAEHVPGWDARMAGRLYVGRRQELLARLEQWVTSAQTNHRMVGVSVTGAPSSGKSKVAHGLHASLLEKGGSSILLETDLFHGTERGSSERARMTGVDTSDRTFLDSYTRPGMMQGVFSQFAHAGPGDAICVNNMYNRPGGGMLNEPARHWQMGFRGDPTVLITEGVAAPLLWRDRLSGDMPQLRISMVDDPARQILRVMARDVIRSTERADDHSVHGWIGRDMPARMDQRIREYARLLPLRARGLFAADIVWHDADAQKRFTKKMSQASRRTDAPLDVIFDALNRSEPYLVDVMPVACLPLALAVRERAMMLLDDPEAWALPQAGVLAFHAEAAE